MHFHKNDVVMRYPAIIFLLFSFCISFSQESFFLHPSEKEAYIKDCNEIANNKIHQKIVWRHQDFNGMVSPAKYKSEIITYDSLGRIVEWENYNVGNLLETVSRFTYENKYVPATETEYLSTGQLLYKTEYIYNGEFIAEQRFYYGNDNLRVKIEYSYDTVNNTVTEFKFYPADNLRSIKKYYFEDGKKQKEDHLRSDSSLYYFVDYEYGGRGNLKKESYFTSQGNLISEIKYNYDSDNNLVKAEKKNNKGEFEFVRFYKYNSAGKLIGFEEKDGSKSTVMMLRYGYEYY